MMGATRTVRRRPLGAAVVIALAVAALTLLVVAGVARRTPSGPMLATIAVGSWAGLPMIGVDEVAGRAYVVAGGGAGPGGGAGVVRVLDTATGALVRTAALPGQTSGGVAVAVDARRGRAYAVSAGSTVCGAPGGAAQSCTTTGAALVALDARTGRPSRPLGVDAGLALTVDGRTGLLDALPAGGATDLLRVLDPGSGRVVRTIVLPGSGQGIGFGALAIEGSNHHLVVVRSSVGGLGGPRWSADVVDLAQGRLLRHIPLPGTGSIALYHPPIIDEARGRAYVGLGSYGYGVGRVAVIDTRRATLLRATATGAGFGAIAEDTRTGRVFTTALGGLRTVTTRTPGGGTSSTQVPAGVGGLRVLDAGSGVLLRSVPIGVGTTDVAVDERRGRVYVLSIGPADAHNGLTRPGMLSVVDERSGQVVRTLAVGAVPVTLALDRHHDRLLVGCIGAFGGTPDDPWGWVPGQVRRLLPFLPRPPAPIRTPQGSVLILDTTRL